MLGQNLSKVQLSDMFSAEQRIRKVTPPTPLITMEPLNMLLKYQVYLKAESLLPSGAFKFRGAFNKISWLKENYGDNVEVVTASSGNHGMAVALSSRLLGLKATVVVPSITPEIKKECIRSFGADIIVSGATYDDSFLEACRIAEEKGCYYVHSVSDVEVLGGQGTISLEIIRQLPDVEQIVVPLGGGGLITGISYAIKQLKPKTKVCAVMPEHSAVYAKSREAGRLIELREAYSVADAVIRKTGESYLFPYIEQNVDEIFTVGEETIKKAVRAGLLYGKLMLEGSGALPLAAAMEGKIDLHMKTVLVCSGGNIDQAVLQQCLDAPE